MMTPGGVLVTRVLILGDTHLPSWGQLPAELIHEVAKADLVVHTGDFDSLDVYSELAGANRLYAVRGNRDEEELDSLLPPLLRFDIAGMQVVLVHGDEWGRPRPSRLAREFASEAQVVIYGHLHKPYAEELGTCLVINPGSPTAPRSSPASYITADFHAGQVEVTVRLVGGGQWNGRLFTVPGAVSRDSGHGVRKDR
jgi:putative phosphoesterase